LKWLALKHCLLPNVLPGTGNTVQTCLSNATLLRNTTDCVLYFVVPQIGIGFDDCDPHSISRRGTNSGRLRLAGPSHTNSIRKACQTCSIEFTLGII